MTTCGHETDEPIEQTIKDYTRDFDRAVIHGKFCPACAEFNERMMLVLLTDKERLDWMAGLGELVV